MTIEYKGQKFLSDNDLKIQSLGFWPRIKINHPLLKNMFYDSNGRDFLGGDELVAYAQVLVSKGMDFSELENNIFEDTNNSEKGSLVETIHKKIATGIGRGHSLGGLSGIVLGINGTKMIDSGLTGFVASRSLVTSSRRRETTSEEIAVPESLLKREDLLDEYLSISKDLFEFSSKCKEKFGKLGGVETFNKVIPYNSPADLFIVMPLDTMATLDFEVQQDNKNSNGRFLPKEMHYLADLFPGIAEESGIDVMFKQRIKVPRDGYLHYNVFKDPSLPNYALERGIINNMNINPVLDDFDLNISVDFKKSLEKLKKIFQIAREVDDPNKLSERSMDCMLAMRNFVGEYNEAVRIKIVDSISWRVWSEQKRHSTLRQNVESVYSAAERSLEGIKPFWELIEKTHKGERNEELPFKEIENFIIIDDRLKKSPELAIPYVYYTARQLMFYGKLLENGIEDRDALFIVPKNIRLRSLENYDLVNLIDLELPLRLCNTCEPERKASSWKKRELIAQAIPDLDYFLQPKCSVGMCTEGNFCGNILSMREYNKDLHNAAKRKMLSLD
ncbi:MAG TPA: hypothetical protein P5277_01380 [Candidatus Paceibacterota bacterium]|nr:hypothetical protein [Candidatus Paceibacterota bacterium]